MKYENFRTFLRAVFTVDIPIKINILSFLLIILHSKNLLKKYITDFIKKSKENLKF